MSESIHAEVRLRKEDLENIINASIEYESIEDIADQVAADAWYAGDSSPLANFEFCDCHISFDLMSSLECLLREFKVPYDVYYGPGDVQPAMRVHYRMINGEYKEALYYTEIEGPYLEFLHKLRSARFDHKKLVRLIEEEIRERIPIEVTPLVDL